MSEFRQQIEKKATTLNDNLKIVLDEVERGVYKRPIDVFDGMFNLADQFSNDVLGLLADYVCKSKKELWDMRQDLTKQKDEFLNDTIKTFTDGKIQMIDEIMPSKSIEQILGDEK